MPIENQQARKKHLDDVRNDKEWVEEGNGDGMWNADKMSHRMRAFN